MYYIQGLNSVLIFYSLVPNGLASAVEVLQNSFHVIIQLAVFTVFAEGGPVKVSRNASYEEKNDIFSLYFCSSYQANTSWNLEGTF